MTQSPTELLAEPVTEALHRALAEAWQAGYECALMDNGLTEEPKTDGAYLYVLKSEDDE